MPTIHHYRLAAMLRIGGRVIDSTKSDIKPDLAEIPSR
jgi:hypothetical protein